jgi:preprotein translocase subunit SecE
VARDRKRAKQRRERQAKAEGAQARRAQRTAAAPETTELSGETSIADAQLALGRPELTDAGDPVAAEQASTNGAPDTFEDEAEFEQLEDRVDAAEDLDGDGELEVASAPAAPARKAERSEGNRFANFLRGSWRELQRVQWPDRQQVGQATAVCIGFVLVMGAFLGVMDYFAAKIIDFIV